MKGKSRWYEGLRGLLFAGLVAVTALCCGRYAAAQGTEISLADRSSFSEFRIEVTPSAEAAAIEGITVNHAVQEKKSSKWGTFSGGYYIDTESGMIYMNEPADQAILVIQRQGGVEDVFRYDRSLSAGSRMVAVPKEVSGQQKYLKIRLVGQFESAMVGQRKYDGISGATSGGVASNKNSSVEVQAVLVDSEEEQPEEAAWKPLREWESVEIDRERTRIVIPQETGMSGMYSTFDSSLTLDGTPATAGKYEIYVELTDQAGRHAVSNSLPFHIYGPDEKLIDHLRIENAKRMQDGKYIWDMEPWAIAKFGGTDETVTVPSQLKAWYGSHTSGTYGELGETLEERSESGYPQTLIIGADTDLTLVNMKVRSGVRIIVRDGGRLCLQDSSVYGKIIVENGGRFQMNYDSYGKAFLTGAQINGQLVLRDGAVVESSLIYSNTNFLTDGKDARRNVDPVVTATGDVTVRGSVYIRGDEAPTGTDPKTGEVYTGQPAMAVENGRVTLDDDAVLGVYGGGRISTTTHGADGLILDNAEVTGAGSLIAVGGNGENGRGGDGVSGTGRITAARASLHGGNTHSRTAQAGRGYERESVRLTPDTIGVSVDGRYLDLYNDNSQPAYWSDVSAPPAAEAAPFGNNPIVEADESETPDENAEPVETEPGEANGEPAETEPGKTDGAPVETEPGEANGEPVETEPGEANGEPEETEPGEENGEPVETEPGEENGEPVETEPGETNGEPVETEPGEAGVEPAETEIDGANGQSAGTEIIGNDTEISGKVQTNVSAAPSKPSVTTGKEEKGAATASHQTLHSPKTGDGLPIWAWIVITSAFGICGGVGNFVWKRWNRPRF